MKKHSFSLRLWHWINAVSIVVLFMSGLGISNAHRFLYWGDAGSQPSEAWTVIVRFPNWATIPQRYDLAEARDWHFLFSWPFAIGLLFIWTTMLINGHFKKSIATSRSEWRLAQIREEFVRHITFKLQSDDQSYNFLQKVTYSFVLVICLPVMVLTGLSLSPGFEPFAPWLTEIFGGRQSARSIHFIVAWALFIFFIIHLVFLICHKPIKRTTNMLIGSKNEA